jgi:hypothetical protein
MDTDTEFHDLALCRVRDRELERAAESKLRTNPLAIEPFHQPTVIAGLDRM